MLQVDTSDVLLPNCWFCHIDINLKLPLGLVWVYIYGLTLKVLIFENSLRNGVGGSLTVTVA